MSVYVSRPVSPGTIRWGAERILAMHTEPEATDRVTGRCGQCQPDGRCDLLHWARMVLAADDLDAGQRAG
jgi:hypothetical protein